MRLYFVRHGESEANRLHVISNRDDAYGLTPAGQHQAFALAQALQHYPISTLFSSPICRALETTAILSQALGLPYQITDALREYDCGILEGQSDSVSWQIHQDIAQDWLLHRNWERHPDQGESCWDIQRRFMPFIQAFTQPDSHPNTHALLVSHGGTLSQMLPLILTNIDVLFVVAHPIGHTDCIIAEQRPDGLTCLQWGDISP